jgi:hypothetical protein
MTAAQNGELIATPTADKEVSCLKFVASLFLLSAMPFISSAQSIPQRRSPVEIPAEDSV